MNPVDQVIAELEAAREPEEVFGVHGATQMERRRHAKRRYRALARMVHPDVNPDEPRATEAYRRLSVLWERALSFLDGGTYGERRSPTVVVRTKRGVEYVVEDRFAAGEICDLFHVRYRTEMGLLKVARHPRDNDLVQAEARTLRRLHREGGDRIPAFLPELVDSIGFRASGGIVRRGNVLDRLDGFYSLAAVRDAYPRGVDPRDMAWMWRRLLFILGAAHRVGIVHAAVTPDHVMIHPEEHGLVLVDWAYAVAPGERARAVSRAYRDWSAPELLERKPLTSETDIFMGARAMLSLTRFGTMPRPLRAFFNACAISQAKRPEDAWALQATFDEVLERLYGPRRFRPFTMPTSA